MDTIISDEIIDVKETSFNKKNNLQNKQFPYFLALITIRLLIAVSI